MPSATRSAESKYTPTSMGSAKMTSGLHSDMLSRIRDVCRRQGIEITPLQASELGSLYRVHRPHKTAWQIARKLSDGMEWPERLDADEERMQVMAVLVDDLDAGYWCDTLEHD